MRIGFLVSALAIGVWALSPQAARAQADLPDQISLGRALTLARERNPGFLRVRNDADLATWEVRAAWSRLFPSLSATTGMSWQGAGEQRFGSLTLGDLGFVNQPSYSFSSYGLSLNYQLDWSALAGPSQARARRAATLAQIDEASADLSSRITRSYIAALREQEGLRVAEQHLESARLNLRLAQGQLQVGSVTPIDVGQAEVQVGRAEVGVLEARNRLRTSRLRLLQQIGVSIERDDFELTTSFPLTAPTWALPELRTAAERDNPTLRSRRTSRAAAQTDVRAARSAYLPTLSVSTGWSGFTREAGDPNALVSQAQARSASALGQCVAANDLYARLVRPLPPIDCARLAFSDDLRRSILEENDQFPFEFQRSPPVLSIGLSIPIFPGLGRERNVEEARLRRDDLDLEIEEQRLAIDADLSIALADVQTAYERALLEERNRDLAERQLLLARERYQVGAITFIELMDAQTLLAQAEGDRVSAVYDYHDAVTQLEALVGAPLRN